MAINSESLTELLRLRVEVRRLERDNRLLRAKLLQQQASPSAAIDRLGIELAETQEETGRGPGGIVTAPVLFLLSPL